MVAAVVVAPAVQIAQHLGQWLGPGAGERDRLSFIDILRYLVVLAGFLTKETGKREEVETTDAHGWTQIRTANPISVIRCSSVRSK